MGNLIYAICLLYVFIVGIGVGAAITSIIDSMKGDK